MIMREVVYGLMHILATHCLWRAIPKDLPPRLTLYDQCDLWSYLRPANALHNAPS